MPEEDQTPPEPTDEADAGGTDAGATTETGQDPDVGDGQGSGGEPGQDENETAEQKLKRIARHHEAAAKKATAEADALRSDAEKLRGELDGLREAAGAHEGDLAAARKAVDDLSAQLSEATSTILRYVVGAETGLTLAQAKRLQGSTREELLADAAVIVKEFAVPGPAVTPNGGGPKVNMVEYMRNNVR